LRLGSVTARHWATAKLCGVEQRAMFGRAAITLALAHISSYAYYAVVGQRYHAARDLFQATSLEPRRTRADEVQVLIQVF